MVDVQSCGLVAKTTNAFNGEGVTLSNDGSSKIKFNHFIKNKILTSLKSDHFSENQFVVKKIMNITK
jgi:hypothetical protein